MSQTKVIVAQQYANLNYFPSLHAQSSNGIDADVQPSTSNSTSLSEEMGEKGESTQERKRSMVPLCAICGMDSTGIHFGVDACAACSAFFRRTVVLNKDYSCNKDGKCNVVKDGKGGGQKCRACRFTKCITAGMDKNAVQHRRDAIGKYSAGVKREAASSSPAPDSFPAPPPMEKRSLVERTVLEELEEQHDALSKKRKVFYATKGCHELFNTGELGISELSNFEECMFQLWKIEPRLAADYISNNRFLAPLPTEEKVKIFRNFVVIRQAVEEPYLTWKFGGLENNWWIMPNRIYIDIDGSDKYWKQGVLKNLGLTYNDAKCLFESSFKDAMDTIGRAMDVIQLTETEMIALCGIVLLDPTVATLQLETKNVLWNLRAQLIQDLFNFYEGSNNPEDPEIRLANLFMILAAVKVHALKTSENMHLLNIFELISKDKIFEDICRGNVYETEQEHQSTSGSDQTAQGGESDMNSA